MTDSAGRPGETEAVEAVHRATCHVPNCVARFDAEVAVDAAYPIIAEAVRAETADEVRALRAEREALTERLASANEALVIFIAAGNERAAERDTARAELAAARDQIAAVRAAIEDVATFVPHARNLSQVMDTSLYGAEITMRDRIAARLIAALSQSGQPTKGEPA